jgi:transmembrane sensor
MEEATPNAKNLKQAYRTAYLVAGFIRDTLTQEEKIELDAWIKASDDNMRMFDELTDEKSLQQSLDWFDKIDAEAGLKRAKQDIIFSRKQSPIWKYAVAASLIIAAGLLIYFKPWNKQKGSEPPIVQANDIAPAVGIATLTLENGTVINIGAKDTTINGQIKILQDKAEIMYIPPASSNVTSLIYHTLTVPRKGHYKLILPDGTIAWLNAESSVRYPLAFSDTERRVFITGETYFEVAKDKTRPFRVVTGDVTVEALGTKFNVNAYTNESHVAATLVEGSVLITKGSQENILKPGQQAQLNEGKFDIVNADINEVTAWKNDQFKFINTPIESIMRQIERWYDAEVVYRDKLTLHLNATIERDVPVSKLLHLLEQTNEVHFKIDGKKIIVIK